MGSVVLELQRNALDRNVKVSDLLRKSLVVARKLALAEFQAWIEKELSGYPRAQDIPDYRVVTGQIRAWNPYNGWIPVIFNDPREGERLSRRKCGQSIAEIENLLDGRSENGILHMPFSQEVQRRLGRGMEFDTEVSLFTQHSGLVRIIDTVRNTILNWSIKLEEDGILGEGLSFTPREKQQAGAHGYNITNFFGPVQSPQVQQGAERAVQVSVTLAADVEMIRRFLNDLRHQLSSLNLSPDARAEAEAEIATVEAQVQSPNPKPSIIREGLSSLGRILEGATGGAAGQLLIELAKLLGAG